MFVACLISILLLLLEVLVFMTLLLKSDTIDSILNAYNDHEFVLYVKNNLANPDHFHFAHVSPENVLSVIQSINVKKATGYDMMPPKLVKLRTADTTLIYVTLRHAKFDKI